MNTSSEWELADSGFPAIDKLFRLGAFDYQQFESAFVPAMREAFECHYKSSRVFRAHVEMGGFSAEELNTLSDVERIPWIFVQSFKKAELLSVKRSQIALTLTSSGTQGSKTNLFLDRMSLNRLEVAAHEVYKALGILETAAGSCNYLLFTYDIEKAPNLGTAWTDVLIARMVQAEEMVFAIREKNGEFAFDLELALESYSRFVESGKPLRILGFPAFLYATFLEVEKRGLPRLKPEAARESWVLTGGGWKNHKGDTIGKNEFAAFLEKTAGLPRANVRDLFGMAEHGVGYVDCEHGRLHVPVYAHAITRDPFTLNKQKPGEPGMLHLYTPLLRSYPSLSLLTSDEAVIDDSPCRCGRPGPGIEIVGRLGVKTHNGCAIRALEYLKT